MTEVPEHHVFTVYTFYGNVAIENTIIQSKDFDGNDGFPFTVFFTLENQSMR